MYTHLSLSVKSRELPHPNPPLAKGELKGVSPTDCVDDSFLQGGEGHLGDLLEFLTAEINS
jgi:hypothetical protein